MAAPLPGTVDPTFSAGRGPVQVFPGTAYGVVLQSDGKVVVGGGFNGIGLTPSRSVVRFNSDGSVDSTFNSSLIEIDEFASVVFTKPLCIQSDGQVIVGGQFETADGHHSLVRLTSDGGLDDTLIPSSNRGRLAFWWS